MTDFTFFWQRLKCSLLGAPRGWEKTVWLDYLKRWHAEAQIADEEFKKTSLYEKVKYAPSIIIVKNNEIIDFLDANKDEDLKYYQNSKEFASWLKERLVIE